MLFMSKFRRPRSVAIPLAITGLILMGLVYRVARFDERIVVRIARPSGPHPLRLKGGAPYLVEGTVDSGDATYRVPASVILNLISRDEKYGKVHYGSWSGPYDRASHSFSGTITVPKKVSRKEIYLGVDVIDRTGRHHGADPDAPD